MSEIDRSVPNAEEKSIFFFTCMNILRTISLKELSVVLFLSHNDCEIWTPDFT